MVYQHLASFWVHVFEDNNLFSFVSVPPFVHGLIVKGISLFSCFFRLSDPWWSPYPEILLLEVSVVMLQSRLPSFIDPGLNTGPVGSPGPRIFVANFIGCTPTLNHVLYIVPLVLWFVGYLTIFFKVTILFAVGNCLLWCAPRSLPMDPPLGLIPEYLGIDSGPSHLMFSHEISLEMSCSLFSDFPSINQVFQPITVVDCLTQSPECLLLLRCVVIEGEAPSSCPSAHWKVRCHSSYCPGLKIELSVNRSHHLIVVMQHPLNHEPLTSLTAEEVPRYVMSSLHFIIMSFDFTTWTSLGGSLLSLIAMIVSFLLKRILDQLIPLLRKRHRKVKRLIHESVSTLSGLSSPRIPQYGSSMPTSPSTPTRDSE